MYGASSIASARLRLQVGDHAADVTLPASFLPERPEYNRALWAGLLPSTSSRPAAGAARGAAPRGASAGRCEVSLVEIHQPRQPPAPAASARYPDAGYAPPTRKSRFGSRNPASIRAM